MFPKNSPLGKPPSGYQEVLYWKVNEEPSRFVIMNFLPILLAILFGIGFYIFVQVFGGSPQLELAPI